MRSRADTRFAAALRLTPAHDLGAASTFLDVGSGYGKARTALRCVRRCITV
jgi:hypothetical protein